MNSVHLQLKGFYDSYETMIPRYGIRSEYHNKGSRKITNVSYMNYHTENGLVHICDNVFIEVFQLGF